jgi:hypothetical protein
MKRMHVKSYFAGIFTMVLVFSLVLPVAATVGKRTIDVDYSDISVFLDGSALKMADVNGKTVEPFAYNGTTYVPVRAIAESFDIEVRWYKSENSSSQAIDLLSPKSALSEDYPFTGVPRLDSIVGQNAFNMSFPSSDSKDSTIYLYYKPFFKDGTADTYVSLYQELLEGKGFTLFQTDTVNGYPMYHYVNNSTMVFASLTTAKNQADQQEYVSVLVNTEQMKTTSSTPSKSTTGSSSSTTPTPSAGPYDDNDYVVDVPNFDGKCPYCGLECVRDHEINDTLSVWYCRNPKCTHYLQKFQA